MVLKPVQESLCVKGVWKSGMERGFGKIEVQKCLRQSCMCEKVIFPIVKNQEFVLIVVQKRSVLGG